MPKESGKKLIAQNRKARHDFHIEDTFEAGLVLTVEPGYYAAEAFGIRIENQVEVVEDGEGFLRLQSLTQIPIATDMIDIAALTPAEIAFFDAYHAGVRARLLDRVLPETRDYLVAATAPLSS